MVSPCQADDVSNENDHSICAVCRDDIEPDASRSTTPCGHIFHFGCLALSMQISPNCPLCRRNVLPDPDETSAGEENETIFLSDSEVMSTESGIEIEISDVDAGGDSFNRLMRTIGRIGSRGDVNVDLYVSEPLVPSPPPPPPPPCVLPPTASNIVHYAKEGEVTQVQNMLSHDPTLVNATDACGDTLLHLAVIHQHEYLARYLATNVEMSVNLTNKARMTPLHYAVCTGNLRLVTLALNLGCFVDAADCSGRTPLHHSVMRCDASCLDLLICRSAYVNTTDMAGDTALHYAGRDGWLNGVRKLSTSRHCVVDVENCLGETPLHMASKSESPACITFLIMSGANPAKRDKSGCAAANHCANASVLL